MVLYMNRYTVRPGTELTVTSKAYGTAPAPWMLLSGKSTRPVWRHASGQCRATSSLTTPFR